MTQPMAVIERQFRAAPLGLRFWDEVLDVPVGDGLIVTASPLGNPALVARATVSPSGVYGFCHLPGLAEVEQGAGDAAYWAGVPRRRFTVSVVDTERRFQSFHFVVAAPTQGIITSVCDVVTALPVYSPPQFQPGIPLYSTPTRPTPPGMAVLRADLWDTVAQAPAAWALVAAQPPSQPSGRQIAWGMADANGRVAVYFPYPEPAVPGPAMWQQKWQVGLLATYTPSFPVPAAPDLCAAQVQAAATLWSDWAQTLPLTAVTLAFGEDLVVRTLNTIAQPQQSVLLITPAGSPP
jgi:hypothetical protein